VNLSKEKFENVLKYANVVVDLEDLIFKRNDGDKIEKERRSYKEMYLSQKKLI